MKVEARVEEGERELRILWRCPCRREREWRCRRYQQERGCGESNGNWIRDSLLQCPNPQWICSCLLPFLRPSSDLIQQQFLQPLTLTLTPSPHLTSFYMGLGPLPPSALTCLTRYTYQISSRTHLNLSNYSYIIFHSLTLCFCFICYRNDDQEYKIVAV